MKKGTFKIKDILHNKRFIFLFSLTGVLMAGLIVIAAVMIFKEDVRVPKVDQVKPKEIPSIPEKPSDTLLALRSRFQWKQELINNIKNNSGFISRADVQRLLKMKLGLSIIGDMTQKLKIELDSFLNILPFVQTMNAGACDVIILYDNTGPGNKLIINSQ